MTFAVDRCAVCASSGLGGTLTFTTEVRTSQGIWNAVSTNEDLRLCVEDYDRFTSYADAITGGEGRAPVLGIPLRPTSVSLGSGHCDCCQAELPEQASTLELVPAVQVYRRGSRTHRDGALRRLRVCRLCLGWWRSILLDPSAVTGLGHRRDEGSPGGWLNPGHGDAAAHALRGRDLAILATTMEADGTAYRRLARGADMRPGEIVFAGAGKRDRAAAFVRSVDPAERHRVVVVAHSDQLADARLALQAGAGELLASPISPQQIVGAAVRMRRRRRPLKDAATGLPILTEPLTAFGPSCLSYTIHGRDATQVMEVALLARRFVRGYDEVGSDGHGGIRIFAYAEPTYRARIAARLEALLGKGLTVVPGTVSGQAAAVAA